jgi:hypothetical protein
VTVTSVSFLFLIALAALSLWAIGRREHRVAMQARAQLLDEAARTIPESLITHGEDGFPDLTAHLEDGRRWKAEIVADSLVPRRLPQLWLKLTLFEMEERPRPHIGILTRPTGSEFYSMVQDMPDRLLPPFHPDGPLMMRGRRVPQQEVVRLGAAFQALLSDPLLKEAAATSRGVRIVRRLSEGGRGAHMVFRQMRFPLSAVPCGAIDRALDDACFLGEAADAPTVQKGRAKANDL